MTGFVTAKERCSHGVTNHRNCWIRCSLEKGHAGQCLDRRWEPLKWSDRTYMGTGAWGP